MELGILEVRRDLRLAFENGLRLKFGDAAGPLLAEVISYGPHGKLDLVRLRHTLEEDAAAVVAGIVANRLDPSLMVLLRNQMIGCALIEDKEGVRRWATEGANRCQRIGGPWAATLPQWQWALEKPNELTIYARHLKYLFNQL